MHLPALPRRTALKEGGVNQRYGMYPPQASTSVCICVYTVLQYGTAWLAQHCGGARSEARPEIAFRNPESKETDGNPSYSMHLHMGWKVPDLASVLSTTSHSDVHSDDGEAACDAA
eukprot:gene12378-biopygen2727